MRPQDLDMAETRQKLPYGFYVSTRSGADLPECEGNDKHQDSLRLY